MDENVNNDPVEETEDLNFTLDIGDQNRERINTAINVLENSTREELMENLELIQSGLGKTLVGPNQTVDFTSVEATVATTTGSEVKNEENGQITSVEPTNTELNQVWAGRNIT